VRGLAVVTALLRRLRAERSTALLLFVLVAATSFVVAAGPRLFNAMADGGLRYDVTRASAVQRNVQFTTVEQIRAARDDPFANVVDRGSVLRARLPPSVNNLISEERYVVDSVRFRLLEPPNFRTFVTLRQQDGLDGQLELVEGRWPAAVPPDPERDPDAPPRFEIALSVPTVAATQMTVGSVLLTNADPTDPLLQNVFPRPTTAVELVVVGRFSVRDPAAPLWYDDETLNQVGLAGTDDNPTAYATGLFAPDAYDDLTDLSLPMRYRWRELVDPERLDAGQLDVLLPALRRMETSFSTTGVVRAGTTVVRSGLLGLVESYVAQRATSEAALSVAALGPLAVAAAAVGLVGFLVIRRRRPALALARGRGASGRQLLAAQLWEGLLLTIPAAVVGLVAATTLIDARPSDLSLAGSLSVALAATGLLLASTWPIARRARRDLEREDPPVFRISPRRLVFETLIVGVSLVAAWLLRERGIAGARVAQAGIDPFLAASPILVGLAVGLLTIRLYPMPVRALGWLLARRRDLVPVLGLRNLGRHPTSGYLPLLILMLTVAIGTFSSVVQVSIERSQLEVSWQEVGADYRIEARSGGSLPADTDPSALPGVAAVAKAFIARDAPLSTAPGQQFRMLFEAVEPGAHAALLAGSPVAIDLSTALDAVSKGPAAGTEDDPIPAVVSRRLPNSATPLALGDRFRLDIGAETLVFRVAGFIETFPGIGRAQPFVIASYGTIETAATIHRPRPTTYFVRGGPDAAGAMRASIAPGPGAPVVTSRYERFAEMHDAPLVGAVVGGFALALGVAGAYAALAVVAVVILHAQRRSREIAFLRTLGLSDRQVASLTLVEQGFPVVLALVIGVVLGLALAWLLAPGIRLDTFSSPDATVLLQVDWVAVTAVGGTVVAVVAVAVGASSWLARRLDVGEALRIGEQ
jgi:putative ABC transport system permease protein